MARLAEWKRALWRLVFVERRELSDAGAALQARGLWSGSLAEIVEAVGEIEAALPAGSLPGRRPRVRALGDLGEGADRVEPRSAASSDPARLASRQATHAAFARTLGEFDPEDVALIRVYFLSGLTAAEVTRVAGYRNPTQVYEHVRRVLKRLREGTQRNGLEASDLADLEDFDWSSALGAAPAEEVR